MDVREKLAKLVHNARMNALWHNAQKPDEYIADLLMEDGVTVQECGHWVSYQSDEPYGCKDEKEWHKCSKCGKDAYGRCYEDEWYSAPILSNHCPHCGAKMVPQPPKGE